MNGSIIRRVFWKEYRTQRTLWIAMVLLIVVLQLITLVATVAIGGEDAVVPLFTLAMVLSALYALGCGATLFAAEHEAGTFEFQRILPVAAWRLFLGKVAFAVLSTIAMLGVGWGAASLLAGWQWPDTKTHVGLWSLCGVGAFELLAWAVFFSLLSTRPLKAAILAMTVVSVIVHFVYASLGVGETYNAETYLSPAAVPYRLAIVAMVALLDVWLGCRWFARATITSGEAERGDEARLDQPVDVSAAASPQRRMILGRLLWQQWRQSVGMMGTLALLVIPMVLFALYAWHIEPFYRYRYNIIVLLSAAMASLMGVCVFLGDQRRESFRILTEHGVGPRWVWLSRQLVWIPPVILLTLTVLPLFFLRYFHELDRLTRHLPYGWEPSHFSVMLGDAAQVGFFLVSVALGYATGQLCSMFFRSGLLAVVFGLILSLVLCSWAGLMWWWEVPLVWSVAPIPWFLLLATWRRAPDWLLQRNRARAWLRPALTLAVPAVLLLVGVPLFRLYQIPYIDPGFSPEKFARAITPEEEETVEMYRRALDRYVSPPPKPEVIDESQEPKPDPYPELTDRQKTWVDSNGEAMALAMQASRREACIFSGPGGFYDPKQTDSGRRNPSDLANLLVVSGRQLQLQGQLDAAWERYLAALRISVQLRHRATWPVSADFLERSVYRALPYWAGAADQTPDRIHRAIQEVDKLQQNLPSYTDVIKSEYLHARDAIAGDPEALAATKMKNHEMIKRMLWARWMPWEHARAMRLLNRQTAFVLKVLAAKEQLAANDLRISRRIPWQQRREDWQSHIYYYRYRYWEPTFALRKQVNWVSISGDRISMLVRGLMKIETARRAVKLQLALEAWKTEHGQVPDTLDQLVGAYLDRLPIDPGSGEAFRYFRDGLPLLKPDTPLVWSTGWYVYVSDSDEKRITGRYSIRHSDPYDDHYSAHGPRSESEIWAWGWLYPLQKSVGQQPGVASRQEASQDVLVVEANAIQEGAGQ